MIVTLDEMKTYLRVDSSDDDDLILALINSSEKLCMNVAKASTEEEFEEHFEEARIAVMYTAAYMYEHREDADYHALVLTLRSLLFGMREVDF